MRLTAQWALRFGPPRCWLAQLCQGATAAVLKNMTLLHGPWLRWNKLNFFLLTLWTIDFYSNGKGEVDKDFSYDQDVGSILLWLARIAGCIQKNTLAAWCRGFI